MRRLLRLSRGQRSLLLKAWLLSGYYRAALARRPLKTLLGRPAGPVAAPLSTIAIGQGGEALLPGQQSRASTIGRIAAAAASAPPWRGRCLLQALVGQHLLRNHGIPGELVLGVERSDGSADGQGVLNAHAWLRVGDTVVCGALGHETFTTLARYPFGVDRAEIACGRQGRYIEPHEKRRESTR